MVELVSCVYRFEINHYCIDKMTGDVGRWTYRIGINHNHISKMLGAPARCSGRSVTDFGFLIDKI